MEEKQETLSNMKRTYSKANLAERKISRRNSSMRSSEANIQK